MKNYLILFIACVAYANNAQTYFPFADSNAVWTVSAHSFQGQKNYAVKGDSVYNSLVYKKYYIVNDTNLATAQFQFYALVRQNTAAKKIYGIKNGTSTEKLLYDFSLNINDTLSVNSFDFSFGNNNKVKVLAKDSVLINSQYRKRIKLDGYTVPFNGPEYWTEGVGSNYGIFNGGVSGLWITDVCFPTLLCYKQNSVLAYKNPSCITCFDIICTDVGVNEIQNNNTQNVYPNPAKDILNIDISALSLPVQSKIKMTDPLGRIVLETEIAKQINIKELKPGIYFLQVYHKEKLIAIEKIIKE